MRKLMLFAAVSATAVGLTAGPALAGSDTTKGETADVCARLLDRKDSPGKDWQRKFRQYDCSSTLGVRTVADPQAGQHDDSRRATGASAPTTTTAPPAQPGGQAVQADGVVTLLHAIPDVAVDIYVEGNLVAANAVFGDEAAVEQQPGPIMVKVVPAGGLITDPAIKAFTVQVKANVNKTVALHLDAAGDAKVTFFYNNVTQNQTKAQLTVRHLAAAPAVDVYVDDALTFAGLENRQQAKAFLDAGTSTVRVTAAGDPATIVVPDTPFTLEARTNTIVSAVGSLTGGTFATELQVLPMDCTDSCP